MAANRIKNVLCLGDSHTQGQYGANFVNLLAARHKALTFINAGKNGEVSQQIMARMPALIEQHNPAAAVILAGSNDCIACQNRNMQDMYTNAAAKAGLQLTPCSLPGYLQNMAGMLSKLQDEGCKCIVVTLPPLTEEPLNPANRAVQEFNTALQQMIRKDFTSGTVEVADFHATCLQYLQQHSPAYQQQQQQVQPSAGQQQQQLFQFTVWSAMRWMLSGLFMHQVLRVPLNTISRWRGMYLMIDHIHFNDTAAALLADALEPALRQLQEQED